MRELVMSRIEPVDDRLAVYTQSSAHSSEAHPFQVHLHGLCSELRRVTHRLLMRCEVAVALSASHTLSACAVEACFLLTTVTTTIRTRWLFHGSSLHLVPAFRHSWAPLTAWGRSA